MLVGMSIWLFLAILAISITALLYVLLKPKKDTLLRGAKLGILLVLVDFVFENAGLLLGQWKTFGSIFAIGAVPIEVMVIAFCIGGIYSMVFARKFILDIAITSSLLIAVVGTGIEAILLSMGVFVYYTEWTAWHALVSYFIAFLLMHKLNSLL
jgi:hypothetical protein